jgi:hypothetical protein
VLTRSLTILAALACGALLGVAIVFLVSKNPPTEQRVGGQPLSCWLMCLDADKPELRKAAEANLPVFGAPAAMPMIERLDSTQPETAEAALWTLTRLGVSAVPDITTALRTVSPSKRATLIKRLQVLGAAASAPAAPQIAEYLDDPLTASAAARYFVAIGPTRQAIAVCERDQGPVVLPARSARASGACRGDGNLRS